MMQCLLSIRVFMIKLKMPYMSFHIVFRVKVFVIKILKLTFHRNSTEFRIWRLTFNRISTEFRILRLTFHRMY